jgi:hypothetical protein
MDVSVAKTGSFRLFLNGAWRCEDVFVFLIKWWSTSSMLGKLSIDLPTQGGYYKRAHSIDLQVKVVPMIEEDWPLITRDGDLTATQSFLSPESWSELVEWHTKSLLSVRPV